jgi:general secretion pathway protein C
MAATTAKEWALAIGGGLALAAALVTILRRGPDADPPQPPPAVAAPRPAPAPAALPAAPPPPPVTASAPADLSLTGLRTGPDGGMAIIRSGGRDHRLTPGRSLPGGLRLLRVEPGRAILSGPAGEQLLAFPDAPGAMAGAAPAQPPGGDPTPWRLALSQIKSGNQALGWRLGSLSSLPMLARAGLQPGDILLSANGQDLLSEEKIIELPQELATNGQLVLRYRRGPVEREARVTP